MLTVSSVSKAYGSIRAVRNVSFTLQPGRIMVLLGSSGSGKSTLLRLLAGLLDADKGDVWLDEKRVAGPAEVLVPGHDQIRLVHQEYELMPNVSARENIAYTLRYFETDYRNYRVNQLLRSARLLRIAGHKPSELSGGEKQRVAIAKAVADFPAVLLLDEPFSHLDNHSRQVAIQTLLGVVRQQQTACLLVTHETQEALMLADTLGVLQAGKIVQMGAPEHLYHRPATPYVAQMTGTVNLVKSQYFQAIGWPAPADETVVGIRPEHIQLAETGLPAQVLAVYFKGQHYEADVQAGPHLIWRMVLPDNTMQPRQRIHLYVPPEHLIRFSKP